MNVKRIEFTPKQAKSCETSLANMINTLSQLCHDTKEAELELVSLHLDIAFAELTEHHFKKMLKFNNAVR
ncbi:hypothetical protein MNBD_ALPHA02-1120 [hydrothermal vent metagenome]|uniref:Uncharacterized protein n=1 Tax=hydrothermal vent metagenome TaxID=652676 RepID=A0A3B0R3H8_9ZZZZ